MKSFNSEFKTIKEKLIENGFTPYKLYDEVIFVTKLDDHVYMTVSEDYEAVVIYRIPDDMTEEKFLELISTEEGHEVLYDYYINAYNDIYPYLYCALGYEE